ncbi:unnamed protein product [Phytophthora fragariaefolia]|uniref:Unnamed protein product n=1 Tax=Phytophthora fragariaefolia TaxID=1490495 RepID=A0A9W6XX85_9STRA|nr:unnamed protein product [Phytophthora fragariaefolia]
MEIAVRKKDPDLYKEMTQQIKHNASFTTLQLWRSDPRSRYRKQQAQESKTRKGKGHPTRQPRAGSRSRVLDPRPPPRSKSETTGSGHYTASSVRISTLLAKIPKSRQDIHSSTLERFTSYQRSRSSPTDGWEVGSSNFADFADPATPHSRVPAVGPTGLIFSSVCTDMDQLLMDMEDGFTMWKYLCDRYESTAKDQTRAMTKRQMYAQLETAKCTQNGKMEGHLNYMCRLKGRRKTVGMTVDDAVFVDAGMDCVDTPEKVVAMAVTFDKANQADEQWHRSYGAKQHSGQQNKSGGGGQGKGGYESASSKGQGKSRSCFVCGSTDHLKAGYPDKAKKQSGDEAKRVPRGKCTLRQDDHTSPVVALSDEEIIAAGVVTGITMLTRTEGARGDDPRDDQEAEGTELIQEADHQETMDTMEAGRSWWYFDTASNSHVTGARSQFITFTENTASARNIRGLSPSIISRIAGVGTVALVNEVN